MKKNVLEGITPETRLRTAYAPAFFRAFQVLRCVVAHKKLYSTLKRSTTQKYTKVFHCFDPKYYFLLYNVPRLIHVHSFASQSQIYAPVL